MYKIWFLCLTIAAIYDIKERKVSYRLLAVCGGIGMIFGMMTGINRHIQGLIIGLGILLISRVTRGAVGAGDGWFFVASAWYLNSGEAWTLLLGGLSVSWCWSALLILNRAWHGRNAANATLPFLACMWPISVWILLKGEGII